MISWIPKYICKEMLGRHRYSWQSNGNFLSTCNRPPSYVSASATVTPDPNTTVMTFDCNLQYQPRHSPFLKATSAINQTASFPLLIPAPVSGTRVWDCCLPAQERTDTLHQTHPIWPSINIALSCLHYLPGNRMADDKSALEDIPCAAVGGTGAT